MSRTVGGELRELAKIKTMTTKLKFHSNVKFQNKLAFMDIERNLQQVKQLQCEASNRRCADCNSSSLYVVTKYNIFVCIRCAGIHRCFMSGMYVKGLTTANFSQMEVDKLRMKGNEKSNAELLANFKGTYPTSATSSEEMKEFINRKYVGSWKLKSNLEEVDACPTLRDKTTAMADSKISSTMKPGSSSFRREVPLEVIYLDLIPGCGINCPSKFVDASRDFFRTYGL